MYVQYVGMYVYVFVWKRLGNSASIATTFTVGTEKLAGYYRSGWLESFERKSLRNVLTPFRGHLVTMAQ